MGIMSKKEQDELKEKKDPISAKKNILSKKNQYNSQKQQLLEYLKKEGGCVLMAQIVDWAQKNFGTTTGITDMLKELLDEGSVKTCGNGKGIQSVSP